MANGLVAADILEQVSPERFAGVVYRVMINDYPPDKENTVGARWNPKDTAAIYTRYGDKVGAFFDHICG